MSAQPERGTVVGARYRLDSVLGEGGMAVVWRATHTETDRPVALKLVRREFVKDDQVREMFVREARVAARIGANKHIVDVLDAGVDPTLEVPFIAMELLVGEPLDVRIKQQGPVPHAMAADLLEQLADALDQAHGAGVFHRDLKPQNIFLSRDKKQRVDLKVLDFGIAKLSESVQQSSTHVGTPAYSAPEQLGPSWRTIAEQRGRTIAAQVSAATDVWAMGLVVYEMLVGATSGGLWGATTLAELPVKIVLEPTPVATARAEGRASLLPQGFDAWIARCLDLDASKRFPSAGDAAAALVPSLRSTRGSLPDAARPGVAPLPQASVVPQVPQAPVAPQVGPPHPPTGWTPHTPPQPMPSHVPMPQGTPPPLDPRFGAWAAHWRAELRHQVDPRAYLAWNPFQFLGRVVHVNRDARVVMRDAYVSLAEVMIDDTLKRATGEDRVVVSVLTSPRLYYRAALRSKTSTGFADGMARGLKMLDGLVASPQPASSLGDPRLEAFYDLAFPSVQEGNMALPFGLRQLLLSVGFRGVLEVRAGGFVVQLADAMRFDPIDFDKLLDATGRIYAALAP